MSSRRRRKPEQGCHAVDTPSADHAATGSEAGDLERACRRKAVDLLARREHSRLELERKLERRSHPAAVVAAVLDGLEAEGLLSRDRFVESFVRARVAKGHGPVRIARDLAERGVGHGKDLLRSAGYDWPALAGAVRVKRFGREPPRDFKARARQARFLEYRGFTSDQVAAALEIDADSD